MLQYICVKCKTVMESPDSQVGNGEVCPSCGTVVIVPKPFKWKTKHTINAIAAFVSVLIIPTILLCVVLNQDKLEQKSPPPESIQTSASANLDLRWHTRGVGGPCWLYIAIENHTSVDLIVSEISVNNEPCKNVLLPGGNNAVMPVKLPGYGTVTAMIYDWITPICVDVVTDKGKVSIKH